MRNILQKTGGLRRGLKQVHIGQDIWVYGRQKHVPGKGLHMVIYGPDRKEHHVWGRDVQSLCTEYDEYYRDFIRSNVSRHGNAAQQAAVKIYILTSILDKRENWCFDLKSVPANGPLKVICQNGTVKNIQFVGEFHPQELVSKRFTFKQDWISGSPEKTVTSFVNIVGYRKS
jgi:hypothetical protein